ncbi:MAG: hypothetical protein RI907_1385 [Pseudomonadota bacterium]|jgi:peroxiredoxin
MPTFAHRLIALSLSACSMAAVLCAPTVAFAAAAVNAAAPDFTLRSAQGTNLRLQELRGKVVLVNFWATWCGPCRQEMPHLNRLHEKYGKSGFVLLGINVDDDPRKALSVAEELGIRFPVLLDTDKKVSEAYGLQAMPSTFLVDRDGKLRHLHRGYLSGFEAQYEQQIRELLR